MYRATNTDTFIPFNIYDGGNNEIKETGSMVQ